MRCWGNPFYDRLPERQNLGLIVICPPSLDVQQLCETQISLSNFNSSNNSNDNNDKNYNNNDDDDNRIMKTFKQRETGFFMCLFLKKR